MESINKNNQEQEEKVSEALKNKESINYWKLAGLVSFGLLILILLTQLFEINIKPRSLSNGSKQQAKLERLKNDMDNKERIVKELKNQFNNPDPGLTAEDLRDLRDDINLADKKVDELREQVKEETRIYENLKFTLEEIEYDCKRIK